jgi:hypothetical protein
VHDPYCLLFGPDNPECPGHYLVQVMPNFRTIALPTA